MLHVVVSLPLLKLWQKDRSLTECPFLLYGKAFGGVERFVCVLEFSPGSERRVFPQSHEWLPCNQRRINCETDIPTKVGRKEVGKMANLLNSCYTFVPWFSCSFQFSPVSILFKRCQLYDRSNRNVNKWACPFADKIVTRHIKTNRIHPLGAKNVLGDTSNGCFEPNNPAFAFERAMPWGWPKIQRNKMETNRSRDRKVIKSMGWIERAQTQFYLFCLIDG